MELKKIELRLALPEDLKVDKQTLRIGQPFAIVKPETEHIQGIYSLDGTEDPFVLKMYLDREMLFVPINDWRLTEFLKNEKE